MNNLVVVTVIFTSLIYFVNCARILAVVPTPTYSHQVAFRPIWEKLLSRGHELVLLTTDPVDGIISENLTQIDLHSVYTIKNKYTQIMNELHNNPIRFMDAWSKLMEEIMIHELELPEVQNFIHNDTETFDLVMTEVLFPATYGLSERFSCPLIGIISMEAPNSFHSWMGNPVNPVVFPDMILPFYKNLNLTERMISIFFQIFMSYYRYSNLSKDQKILETYFLNNTLTVYELKETMSMLFTNSNPFLHGNRPLGPNTISFNGGVRETKNNLLPKDIDDFLNNSQEGAIYFSLGSNIKSKDLPEETRSVILEAFKKLPFNILWKYEDELYDKPDNVKIVKWVSQQDVLRHKNTKLFISQGGLISVEESISNRVPLIILPFFADQRSNAAKIKEKGLGLHLDIHSLTTENLKTTILEVLTNKAFYKNIDAFAQLSEDLPINGVENAVWWAEYVIRHDGASHLRTPYLDVPFYQYYMLDVLVIFVTFIIIVSLSVLCIIKKTTKFIRNYSKNFKIKND